MLVNPFKLWLALARLPIDAWLSWQYWTPARKAGMDCFPPRCARGRNDGERLPSSGHAMSRNDCVSKALY